MKSVATMRGPVGGSKRTSASRAYPRVCIMGASVETENRGVLALGASLVKLLLQVAPDAELTYLVGNRNSHPVSIRVGETNRRIPVVNFRMSPRARPWEHLLWIVLMAMAYRILPFSWSRDKIKRTTPWIRTVAESDIVGDIRGGDSFSDIYGLKRYLLGSLPVIAVLWIREDIVLFPQTYGPYKTRVARIVAKYILKRSSKILARDSESMDIVRGLIGSSNKLLFCPDVAFALDPIFPLHIETLPPLPQSFSGSLVGLNVNGLMYNGGYNRGNMFDLELDYREFLPKLITTLLQDESVRVLLVPHTFAQSGNVESDPEACRAVWEALPTGLRNRVHLVAKEYDQHEIKGVIGACEFFVGSRMHSCIAALSQGIPTVGIAYSKKFKGVFDSVGVPEFVIDGRRAETNAALVEVSQQFRNRINSRPVLLKRLTGALHLLNQAFSSLIADLSRADTKKEDSLTS